MAESATVSVRFTTQDADVVQRALQALGDEGQKALEKFNRVFDGPTAGQKALNAAVEEGKDKFHEFADSLGPVGNILTALGPMGLAAAAGIGVTVEGLKKLVEAGSEVEQSQHRIAAVLKATDDSSGQTVEGIRALAEEIATTTLANRQDVEQAAAQLATFQNIAGDTFGEVLRLSQDLAATGFGTLTENAVRLGKALEDPVNGMTALRRVGVAFTPEIRDQIKALSEAGDVAAADAIILDELRKKVGGVGAAQGDTLSGAWHAFTQEVGISIDKLAEFAGVAEKVKSILGSLTTSFFQTTGGPLGSLDRDIQAYNREGSASPNAGASYQQKIQGDLDALAAEAASHQRAAAAAASHAIEQQALRATSEALAKTTTDLSAAIDEQVSGMAASTDKVLKHSQAEWDANQQRQENIAILRVQADAAERLAIAYNEGSDVFAKVQTQLAIEANLRDLGTGATQKQRQAVIDLTIAERDHTQVLKDEQQADADTQAAHDKFVADAKRATDQQQHDAEAAFRAEQQFAQQTGGHIVDAFINMAEGAKNPFDNLLNYAKKTFEQIAAAAILNPIILPIVSDLVGSVGGSLGVGGSAASGGALGTASNLVSLGGGLYQLGGSGTSGLFSGIGSTVSSSINSFGASTFGLSPGTVAIPSVTDAGTGISTLPGSFTVEGTTLTSILSSGAIGAVGSGLLANLFGERNPTAASAVGGVGGLIAGAAGAGPIGIAAAVIGGLIAGLFGAKPSNKTEGYQFDPSTGVNTQVGNAPGSAKFDQGNLTAAGSFMGAVDQFVTGITAATGASYVGGKVGFDTGNRDGSNVYFYNPANPLPGGVGSKNFSDPKDALAYTFQQLTAEFTNLPADVETAFKNIDWTGDLQNNLSLIQFAANFHDTVQAMMNGQIDIQKDAYASAAQAVTQYVTQIQTFKDTTAKLGLDTGAANDAAKAFVLQLIGLKTVTAPDALQQQIQSLKGQFSALQPLLDEVGLSAADAAAGLQKQLDALTAAKLADIASRDNAVTGKSFLNDIGAAIATWKTDAADLAALNDNAAPATQLLDDTLSSIIDKAVTAAPDLASANTILSTILTTFADMSDVVAAANDELAKLPSLFSGAAARMTALIQQVSSDQLAALQTQAQAASTLLSSFQGISGNAGSAITSLDSGALGNLSPEQQRGNLLGTLQDAYTRSQTDTGTALAGDQQTILNTWQPFLQASQAYYRTSAAYYQDETYVRQILQGTKSSADTQVSLLQTQVSQLNALIASVQALGNANGSTNVSAIGGYSFADADALTKSYMNAQAASGLGTTDYLATGAGAVWIAARNKLIAGTTDPTLLLKYLGDAQAQAATPGLESLGTGYVQAVMAQLHTQGVAGYADGGVVDRPTFAMIGEGRFKEAVVPLPDGRAIRAQVTDGGDTALLAEMRSLKAEVIELRKTSDRHGRATVDGVDALARNTAMTSSQSRRAGYGR